MNTMPPLDNQMFKGYRVIELAQFVFVPAAGAMLADLGAEVIKIELIDGDPYRTMKIADGRETKSANLAMEQNNRGKKSIALDLKTEEGRELLLKLVETADVFLTSLRPQALERLDLGKDVLSARNSKIIYVQGNGLGLRGPEAHRAGYDASCFWARGGFSHVLTPPGQYPTRPRPALGDHTGAAYIAFGIASALLHRERTGEATVVETSLLSSAMWTLSSDVTVTAALTDEQIANVSREGLYAFKRAYQTSDGRWIQLMFLDPERYWSGLCERLNRTAWLDDPRYADIDARIENGDELIEELMVIFAEQDLQTWRRTFAGWDAPWEVVQTMREIVNDPQALANNYMYDVKVKDGTPVTLVAGPVSFNGSAVPVKPMCAPTLGEHTDELIQQVLGNEQDLADLKARKIIR